MMSYLRTPLDPCRLPQLFRRLLIATGLSYVAAVLGYGGVRRAVGPRAGWTELFDDVEPWAYLPAPALIGLGVVLRSRGLAFAGAALVAVFGLRWGRRYLRSTPDAARAMSDLTVLYVITVRSDMARAASGVDRR